MNANFVIVQFSNRIFFLIFFEGNTLHVTGEGLPATFVISDLCSISHRRKNLHLFEIH